MPPHVRTHVNTLSPYFHTSVGMIYMSFLINLEYLLIASLLLRDASATRSGPDESPRRRSFAYPPAYLLNGLYNSIARKLMPKAPFSRGGICRACQPIAVDSTFVSSISDVPNTRANGSPDWPLAPYVCLLDHQISARIRAARGLGASL